MNGDGSGDRPIAEAEDLGGLGGSLSAGERSRRQRAVNFARASIELEGFAIGTEGERDAAQFIGGKIDLEEFIRRGRTRAAR